QACFAFTLAGDRGYCLLLLGMAQQGAAHSDAARESFRMSIALLETTAPDRYADALAMSYRYLGELEGSEQLLRKALAIQSTMPPPLPAGGTHRRLADLLAGQRRLDEADAELRLARAAFASTLDPLDVERVELEAAGARLLLAQGKAREARELFH